MRIAILGSRGVPARYGGFETFAEELGKRLVKQNIHVTIYCESNDQIQLASFEGIELRHFRPPGLGNLKTVLFDIRCLLDAKRDFEVVFMLGYGSTPFCLIPRLFGKKIWLNVDGIEWARGKWSFPAKMYFKIMEWMACWVPNRVIADSAGIMDHLKSRHKIRSNVSVIPYGAPVINSAPDISSLSKYSLESNGYYLVVARLEPENNIKQIIEGFLASGIYGPLVIVGDHKIRTSYVDALLKTEGKTIKFVGPIFDNEDLQAIRYHAVAYFHGHSVGGTNPSLLEALGCGNIVIAHDNRFNREVCGELGYYFKNPGDIPRIIDEIQSLSHEEAKRLKSAAKKRVSENYNWDLATAKYYDLLIQEFKKK